MKVKKGWYKKAKIKFIEERVYSFSISKNDGIWGTDRYSKREGEKGLMEYHNRKPDWLHELGRLNYISDIFLFAERLGRKEKFYFTYKLKKELDF